MHRLRGGCCGTDEEHFPPVAAELWGVVPIAVYLQTTRVSAEEEEETTTAVAMAVARTKERAAATKGVPARSAQNNHLVLFLTQGVVSLLCAEDEVVVVVVAEGKEKAEEKEKEEIGVDLD